MTALIPSTTISVPLCRTRSSSIAQDLSSQQSAIGGHYAAFGRVSIETSPEPSFFADGLLTTRSGRLTNCALLLRASPFTERLVFSCIFDATKKSFRWRQQFGSLRARPTAPCGWSESRRPLQQIN